MMSSQSRHSVRAVRTKRSAIAFAFGARTGALMISMPSLVKTVSKSRVNLLSRSRIRKRNDDGCSWSAQANWRACWVTQAPLGFAVQPARWTASAAKFDKEEDVQPLQRDRLDGEEVDCEHALRLCPQEGTPGEPGTRAGRAEPCFAQDLLHRRGRHSQPEAVQLAGDPLVAPARVLARQAKHQFADLAADRRSTAPTGVRPAASDEAAVPAQQRRRRNQKRPPTRPRQQPTRRSKEDPVGRCQPRPTRLPTKHRQLMSKDDDLQLLEVLRARPQEYELEHAAERQVAERPEQEPTPRNQRDGRTTLRSAHMSQSRNRVNAPHRPGGVRSFCNSLLDI